MSTRVVHCMEEDYDVYIGRGKCPKTGKYGKWGNDWSYKKSMLIKHPVDTIEEAIAKHREMVLTSPEIQERIRKELRGKVLGCWCHGELCHGQVYVEIADQDMGNPILIDGNNCIVRNIMTSAFDDLQANGTFTGGIYGTINMLAPMLARPELNAGEIICFFDNGVPPARKAALPGYKATRKEDKKKLSDEDYASAMGQLDTARKMLELLGVVCAAYKDREADDGCAAASQVLCRQGQHPIIISSDKDLYQCIRWGARVWDIGKKVLVTAENFKELKGVAIENWLLYRTLTGDISDDIKGALGVSEVRAKQLVEMLGDSGLGDCDSYDQLLDLNSLVLAKWADVADKKGYSVLGKKTPAWARGVYEDLDRLRREMSGIDLRDSFGGVVGLTKKLRERPPVQPKEFLKFCHTLKFSSVLMDPVRHYGPFLEAASRRNPPLTLCHQ